MDRNIRRKKKIGSHLHIVGGSLFLFRPASHGSGLSVTRFSFLICGSALTHLILHKAAAYQDNTLLRRIHGRSSRPSHVLRWTCSTNDLRFIVSQSTFPCQASHRSRVPRKDCTVLSLPVSLQSIFPDSCPPYLAH